MKVIAEYKYDGKKYIEEFVGDNYIDLLEAARKCKHYIPAEEIMYDYIDDEEVAEDGNK